MTKNDYLKIVKKELAKVRYKDKDDVFSDISSYIESFKGNDEELVERFGLPKDLVGSYLQETSVTPSLSTKIKHIIKILFKSTMFVVFTIIAVLIIAYSLYNYFTGDVFDLSDNTAPQWQVTQQWRTIDVPDGISIHAEQAYLAIRYHAKNRVSYQCRGKFQPRQNIAKNESVFLLFEKSHCLVYLPMTVKNYRLFQSNTTIIYPSIALYIEAEQSKIRFAERDSGYQYNINQHYSDAKQLISNNNSDVHINLNLKQSKAIIYEY